MISKMTKHGINSRRQRNLHAIVNRGSLQPRVDIPYIRRHSSHDHHVNKFRSKGVRPRRSTHFARTVGTHYLRRVIKRITKILSRRRSRRQDKGTKRSRHPSAVRRANSKRRLRREGRHNSLQRRRNRRRSTRRTILILVVVRLGAGSYGETSRRKSRDLRSHVRRKITRNAYRVLQYSRVFRILRHVNTRRSLTTNGVR